MYGIMGHQLEKGERMIKRRKRELTQAMTSAIALLEQNGFTYNVTSGYMTMKRSFGVGSYNTLTVTLRDSNYSTPYVNAEFFGAGVKTSRNMSYELSEINKLESRIKRIVRKALASADRSTRAQEKQQLAFDATNHILCNHRGICGAYKDEYSGRLIYVANGYKLECGSDLIVKFKFADTYIKLDIQQAIDIAMMLPTKFKEEETH